MKIIVQNATVGKNIALFKKAAEKLIDQKRESSFQDRGLKGFVNSVTGEIYFGERSDESSDKWKPISLFIGEEGDFLVIGIDESQFAIRDFFPSAYRSMIETVRILNVTLQLIQGRFNPELLLKQLDLMEIAISKDIVHDAWHQIDRIEAEKILVKEIPGSYLFRKDEFAALLEDQLLLRHQMLIKCITLSYLDRNSKVVEKTVVRKENRWLFYNDDPSLNGPLFPDIFALLESLGDELKLALLTQ